MYNAYHRNEVLCMTKEKSVLRYLSPEDAKTVEKLTPDLELLIGRNPELRQVDIVIEGGVGGNRTIVHVMKKIFPHALYVGMDVADAIAPGNRLSGSIDEKTLLRILDANKHPDVLMQKAIVKASCVDFDLIRDIMKKTGRSVPLLVTHNALYSLTHTRERNPFEKKKSEIEIVRVNELTSLKNPFFAQIHYSQEIYPLAELDLKTAAQRAGWKTDNFGKNKLLLLRNT